MGFPLHCQQGVILLTDLTWRHSVIYLQYTQNHTQFSTHNMIIIWHRTLGLRQQIQYRNHAKIPIKNSLKHRQLALVRNQSKPSHWSTNPVRSHCHPRSYQQTLYCTSFPPQPPCGINVPSRAQQKLKMKMDLQPDRLRWHHWMLT